MHHICPVTHSHFFGSGPRVELHLSGLIGTASHPDMQKIRIILFFFENMLKWQFEGGGELYARLILGYIFVYGQIKYYSGDDGQLPPLIRILGFPCIVWKALRLLLFTACTCVETFRPRLI